MGRKNTSFDRRRRTERFELVLSPGEEDIIERAAAADEITIADFMRSAAVDRAGLVMMVAKQSEVAQ